MEEALVDPAERLNMQSGPQSDDSYYFTYLHRIDIDHISPDEMILLLIRLNIPDEK